MGTIPAVKRPWPHTGIFSAWVFRFLLAAVFFAGTGNHAARAQSSDVISTGAPPADTYWITVPLLRDTYDSAYQINLINPQSGADTERAWSQTKSVVFYGLGVLGVLFAMPEDMTGWDQDLRIFEKWSHNVTEGPEWDRNNWAYNYIGHTYFGGVYYQVARKSGYRQWDSFIYSFLMSTFYWEYGIEAGAEIPSIQDIAVTPLMGWVYGEWAYQTEIKIRAGNHRVLGSRVLGGIALFFLDPVDSLGRGINRLTGKPLIKAGYGYITCQTDPTGASPALLCLNLTIPLGAEDEQPPPSGPRFDHDPVDTGIVGMSIGTCHIITDDHWHMEDGPGRRVTLGLYPTRRLSFRMAYARGDLEDRLTGDELRYENYSLDGQYYFRTRRRVRPYLTAGLGEQMWDTDKTRIDFQWNAGLGLLIHLHRKWALQADWINYFSPESETRDQTLGIGLTYRFGEGEHEGR
jgi:hypothetical protein